MNLTKELTSQYIELAGKQKIDIENLKPENNILAWSGEEFGDATIESCLPNFSNEVYKITVNGKSVILSSDQGLWLENNKEIKACDIKENTSIAYIREGNSLVSSHVEKVEKIEGGFITYDVIGSTYKNYIVNDIVLHNFDIEDYITSRFVGYRNDECLPQSELWEDIFTTYRATHDAYMKSMNEWLLSTITYMVPWPVPASYAPLLTHLNTNLANAVAAQQIAAHRFFNSLVKEDEQNVGGPAATAGAITQTPNVYEPSNTFTNCNTRVVEGAKGEGLTVDVTIDANQVITSIVVNQPGRGYQVGQVITVEGDSFSAGEGQEPTFLIGSITADTIPRGWANNRTWEDAEDNEFGFDYARLVQPKPDDLDIDWAGSQTFDISLWDTHLAATKAMMLEIKKLTAMINDWRIPNKNYQGVNPPNGFKELITGQGNNSGKEREPALWYSAVLGLQELTFDGKSQECLRIEIEDKNIIGGEVLRNSRNGTGSYVLQNMPQINYGGGANIYTAEITIENNVEPLRFVAWQNRGSDSIQIRTYDNAGNLTDGALNNTRITAKYYKNN